jgi:hypothetical protein
LTTYDDAANTELIAIKTNTDDLADIKTNVDHTLAATYPKTDASGPNQAPPTGNYTPTQSDVAADIPKTVVDQLQMLNYRFSNDGSAPVKGAVNCHGADATTGPTGASLPLTVRPALNTLGNADYLPPLLCTQTDRIQLQKPDNSGPTTPITGVERTNTSSVPNAAILVTQMSAGASTGGLWATDNGSGGLTGGQLVYASTETLLEFDAGGSTVIDTRGHVGGLTIVIASLQAFTATPFYSVDGTVQHKSYTEQETAASQGVPPSAMPSYYATLHIPTSFRYVGVLVYTTGGNARIGSQYSFKPSAGDWLAY